MNAVRDLTVRLMFPRDLKHILAIEEKRPGSWSRENFTPVFRWGNTTGWVAEIGDVIVGHLVFSSGPQGLTLLNVAVAPYWRRQGIARTMLQKLDEKHPARIEATVPESNLTAQMLLRNAGYKAVRVLRDQFGGEDGYVMERRPG